MCTTATRARVRLPWSQTAVPPKGTNCSHCSITWWFEWWERGRGIVGTDKQPLGLQTLFDSEHGEWDLTIAGKYCPRTPEPPPQPTVPSRLLLHEFICAHWFLRGSLLTKFDWLSLRRIARAQSVIWVQAIAYFWDSKYGHLFIPPPRKTSPSHPPPRDCARSLPWQIPAHPQRFGSGTSNSSPSMSAPGTLRSGAGAHGACSFRPLSVRPARPNATSSSRPLESFPIRETTLARWPAGSSRIPAVANAAQLDCRRRHRDGYQVQRCECLPKQSTIRFRPIPHHQITVPHHDLTFEPLEPAH